MASQAPSHLAWVPWQMNGNRPKWGYTSMTFPLTVHDGPWEACYSAERGKQVTITQHAPLRPKQDSSVDIPGPTDVHKVQPAPEAVTNKPVNDGSRPIDIVPPANDVTFTWSVVEFGVDQPGDVPYVRGTLTGSKLPPGERIAARMYSGQNMYTTVIEDGRALFPTVEWVGPSPLFYPPFRTAKVWFPDHVNDPNWQVTQVPCQMRPEDQQLSPYYLFDLDDPMTITLGVTSPSGGAYQVDWGDGSFIETIRVARGNALSARHTYIDGTAKTITLTDSAGRVGRRLIAAPDLHGPWVAQNSEQGVKVKAGISSLNGGDSYTPIFATWGWKDRDFPLWTHPTAPNGKQNAIQCWYPDEYRGQTMTIRVYGPLRAPLETLVRIPRLGERNVEQPDPPGMTGKSIDDTPPPTDKTPPGRGCRPNVNVTVDVTVNVTGGCPAGLGGQDDPGWHAGGIR